MGQTCKFCGKAAVGLRGGKRICLACGNLIPADKVLPAAATAAARVNRSNRKLCSICGADVTFSTRERRGDGAILCSKCAQPPDLPSSVLEDVAPEEAKSDKPPPVVPARQPLMTPGRWITAGGALALTVIVVSVLIIAHPTWERAHHQELLAMHSNADQLLAQGKPKESYREYQRLFEFIGDRRITDAYIREEVESAKASMQVAYARARPMIEKEDAEARAAQHYQELLREQQAAEARVRQQQAELERQRQDAEREAANQAQLTQERLANEQRIRRAQHDLALQQLRRTQKYREIQSQAAHIVVELQAGLIGEDSAYRGISRRADAGCRLLALYVQELGLISGSDRSKETDTILKGLEINLVGEDSALRGTYKRDEAFLKLLGIWCNLLDKNGSGIAKNFNQIERETDGQVALDDSAPRAISAYTAAIEQVLSIIASSQGRAVDVARVQSKLDRESIGEDSAYRQSMRNLSANLDLLLIIIAHDSDPEIQRIRSSISTSMIGEDSALRAESRYRQGMIDAMKWAVDHP